MKDYWEYKVVFTAEALTEAGKDGWEAFAVSGTDPTIWLKRKWVRPVWPAQ